MSMPLELRRKKRSEYAALHGISVKASHHFIKNHPKSRRALKLTEEFTSFKVTRFDLFPEIYDRIELTELLEKTNEV